MTARGKMTMRASVERNFATGKDPWNQPAPGNDFVPVGVLPCRAWSREKRHVLDSGKEAVIEDFRAMVPVGADVQTGDRISSIDTRLGETLFAGPIAVERVSRKGRHGSGSAHLELMLRRHK